MERVNGLPGTEVSKLGKIQLQTDVHKEAESLGPDAYMIATLAHFLNL